MAGVCVRVRVLGERLCAIAVDIHINGLLPGTHRVRQIRGVAEGRAKHTHTQINDAWLVNVDRQPCVRFPASKDDDDDDRQDWDGRFSA